MNLEHSELTYINSIINSISMGILSTSLAGDLTYLNDKAKKFIDFDKYSTNPTNLFSLFPEIKNIIEENKGNPDFLEENLLITRSNVRISCDISVLKNNSNIIGFLLIFKDIKSVINIVNKFSNFEASCTFDDIIGESSQLQNLINDSKKIADSPSTVLITGESGAGKELLAQSIHNASSRKPGPFIAINCGAIPKPLIESELFGYEEGTFTGGKKGGRAGKFELADGGTLFLDEIGEMPFEMQVTLLRVLQEERVTRVGGKTSIPVNVRIIAATNKDLKKEIKNGLFRSDLFYRLNVIPLKVPPLKDRIGDVPVLLDYFLHVKSQKLNKPIPKISQNLYKKIISYCWPGNIRELENCVENLVNLNGVTSYEINFDECHCLSRDNLGNLINEEDNADTSDLKSSDTNENNIVPLLTLEQQAIKKAICICNGNMSKAATKLGISRNALYNKVKRYNL